MVGTRVLPILIGMATRPTTAPVYDLTVARRQPSARRPIAHQSEALTRLKAWARSQGQIKGGILVLPTGGGKTFTAARHLTTGPLGRGQRVLWLAHTHHLLEQALAAFGQTEQGHEVGHVNGERGELRFRTVSGTTGHGRVHHIKATDDVVIITLQTLVRALQDGRHRGLDGFLVQARQSGLTVVFDECHHAPARSYRQLIETLRERVPGLELLGLTATPTYSDEGRRGLLARLFPQGILYQVDTQRLMAQGIMARPHIEQASTHIEASFNEAEYRRWVGTYRDLPETVIAHLASNAERNTVIADHYADNRSKYGKTIVFADRTHQCEALVSLLRARGVRAAALYSQPEHNPGTVDARNARQSSDAHRLLEAFRSSELEVLVNIRMLTEGTDIPDVQTVFLTRQTTSRILLTQMVGRALRGPKFGGTQDAYIVSFIDHWKQHVAWAEWDELQDTVVQDADRHAAERLPVQWVSSELIEHLAKALDRPGEAQPTFLSLLPLGWYLTEFSTAVNADETEEVRRLVPVYDQDQPGFRRLLTALPPKPHDTPFSDIALPEAARKQVDIWIGNHFNQDERLTRLEQDVLAVLRHWGQSGKLPEFLPFEARSEHNLDSLAAQWSDLGRLSLEENLRQEYSRSERLWRQFYPSYEQFRDQFNLSQNQLADQVWGRMPAPMLAEAAAVSSQAITEDEEVSAATKRAVRRRDGERCLCCGAARPLQTDHVKPRYLGGSHDQSNLQTLCRTCNGAKGNAELDFRSDQPGDASHVRYTPSFRGDPGNREELERLVRRVVNLHYGCAAVRSVQIGQRGPKARIWVVRLNPGIPGGTVQTKLDDLTQRINRVRKAANLREIDGIQIQS